MTTLTSTLMSRMNNPAFRTQLMAESSCFRNPEMEQSILDLLVFTNELILSHVLRNSLGHADAVTNETIQLVAQHELLCALLALTRLKANEESFGTPGGANPDYDANLA